MRLRTAATLWVAAAAAATAVAAVPAYGDGRDRLPGFTASWDTTYGQVRELAASSTGVRFDPRTPWTMAVYGGEAGSYPLAPTELRTLYAGGTVAGVERLDATDRIGDDVTFGETQGEVARKMGRMIKGWVFTTVVEGDKYLVFCWTDGRSVLCEILTPIVI